MTAIAARSFMWRARRCLTSCHHVCRTFTTTAARPSEQIRLVEVSPRDGLQNEKKIISVETKMQLIEKLARTGLSTIEAGSFVSPDWAPQMANSSEIFKQILEAPPSPPTISYQFLVPNTKGLDDFLSVYNRRTLSKPSDSSQPVSAIGPRPEISVFTAATETFSQKNANCSVDESLKRLRPVIEKAKSEQFTVRAYVSVALGCPFEGPKVDAHKVASLAVNLLEIGADQISISDTTGMGTCPKTEELLKTLSSAGVETADLAMHFHDTYGQALVNSVVALEHGIRTFDGAVAGLGGCPYSPGATGNVATEDLVHLIHSLGARTGVDIEKLSEVGDWISRELGRANESRVGKATLSAVRRSL